MKGVATYMPMGSANLYSHMSMILTGEGLKDDAQSKLCLRNWRQADGSGFTIYGNVKAEADYTCANKTALTIGECGYTATDKSTNKELASKLGMNMNKMLWCFGRA